AFESATSNSCRVSPVRSITIWTAMCTLLLTYQRVAYSPKLALAIARARRCCAHADVKDACSRRRLPTIPAGQPLEWRYTFKPRLCRLELGGEPQQGRLLAVAGSKMHAHREPVRGPVQRHAHCGRAGGIVQRGDGQIFRHSRNEGFDIPVLVKVTKWWRRRWQRRGEQHVPVGQEGGELAPDGRARRRWPRRTQHRLS